jgi:hypothetical protein
MELLEFGLKKCVNYLDEIKAYRKFQIEHPKDVRHVLHYLSQTYFDSSNKLNNPQQTE